MPMPLSGLAQTLSNSIASIQADIVDTQNQLSAGVKTLNPGENGVVTRLSAQATSYGNTVTNITKAQSVIAVGQAALSSIADVLTQMQALANQSSSSGLQSTDRDSLNRTFSALASQVTTLGSNASVNANNLLSGVAGLNVTTGIAGNAASTTNVVGVDVPTLATTVNALSINSTYATPTSVTTSDVHQIESVGFTNPTAGNFVAGNTITIGGLVFTVGASQTPNALAVLNAFANYITSGSTSPLGSFSGTALSTMQATYSKAVVTSGYLLLTSAASGTGLTTTVTAADGSGATGVTPAAGTVSTSANGGAAAANQKETITLGSGSLASGQSISIDGLVYTAGSTGATGSDIRADYAAYLVNGSVTKGSFSGTTQAAFQALYANSTGSTGSTLVLQKAASGVKSSAVIEDAGALNAKAAIIALNTALSTISTGQSVLSAANTGLSAQQDANTALKTGLTNTVNSIQNIDATAMQAKLQQLNNQQSIDYYLVSQMNTEAAAILSIFR